MASTTIIEPTTPAELDAVRQLMRAFVAWHRQRHREDLALIDSYFDTAAFDAELGALPGAYARPDGRLLLAFHEGQPAGCVALHRLDADACEMKRMFIYPQLQRRGIGRRLAEALLREAQAIGYAAVRLDTSVRQHEALGLYESLGFRRIPPYYACTPELAGWLVFMERRLPQPA